MTWQINKQDAEARSYAEEEYCTMAHTVFKQMRLKYLEMKLGEEIVCPCYLIEHKLIPLLVRKRK